MTEPEKGEVTRLLRAHRGGDRGAFDQLIPLVYQHLRRLARQQLARGGRRNATLDTTALVHEAYVQLVDEHGIDWQDRSHFYAISARVMRRILVDYARHRQAKKRGGGKPDLTLDPERIALNDQAELILAIDRALETLSEFNERLTRVVECRYFAGMTEEETAVALDVSVRTIQRDWTRARAWLMRELQ